MIKFKRLVFASIMTMAFFMTSNVFAEETTYDPETRIKELNTEGTTISTTDHDDELRFIGLNPNNYVSFNGQKWRIVGIFDGKLKIIQDSIGTYSYDTSAVDVNNGFGINQWGPSGTYQGADLMKLLNPGYENNKDLKCKVDVNFEDERYNCGNNSASDYTEGLVNNSLWWNAKSGKCYDKSNYNVTDCDFRTTGLQSDEARNMIDEATWYLGSTTETTNTPPLVISADATYNFERGNITGKTCTSGGKCTDTVTRTTTWTGKVGLLYPSDFAYATAGGSTNDRSTCLASFAHHNDLALYVDCSTNDWLIPTETTYTISPYIYSDSASYAFVISKYGRLGRMNAGSGGLTTVRPVVYLKSDVKFTSGDGTKAKPFVLKDTSKKDEEVVKGLYISLIINDDEKENVKVCDDISCDNETLAANLKKIELPKITKDGYKFEGWYLDSDYKVAIEKAEDIIEYLGKGSISVSGDNNASYYKLYAKLTKVENQTVKTGNTGLNQSILFVVIGSIMVAGGLIIIFKKRKVNQN